MVAAVSPETSVYLRHAPPVPATRTYCDGWEVMCTVVSYVVCELYENRHDEDNVDTAARNL